MLAVVRDERLAFHRASVRTLDCDGRMQISVSPISKVAVNGYRGYEIPHSAELGLDPARLYMLFRSPEELKKAAPSFNRLPLLDKHLRTSASDPQKNSIVGSTGSDAAFEAPYLTNSLAVWDAVAIAGIVTQEQCELSSSYHYKAVMTPGEYQGVAYDGLMTATVGNHVALVEKGRAGPDVVVGDAALPPTKEITMANPATALSRKALFASGALQAYLLPKLANDKAIDLNPALTGVTARNFKAKQPTIIKAIAAAAKGKLAQDADLDSIVDLLNAVGNSETGEEADPVTGDTDVDLSWLEGKITPEDMARLTAMFEAKDAPEADPDGKLPPAVAGAATATDETDEDKAAREAKEKSSKMPPALTKQAMDAAIEVASNKAVRDTMARMQAMRDAERAVRPFIGDIEVAQDSAENVYKLALDLAGVELTGVPPAAYAAMVRMLPRSNPQAPSGARVAMDSAGSKKFAERFPNANRLQKY